MHIFGANSDPCWECIIFLSHWLWENKIEWNNIIQEPAVFLNCCGNVNRQERPKAPGPGPFMLFLRMQPCIRQSKVLHPGPTMHSSMRTQTACTKIFKKILNVQNKLCHKDVTAVSSGKLDERILTGHTRLPRKGRAALLLSLPYVWLLKLKSWTFWSGLLLGTIPFFMFKINYSRFLSCSMTYFMSTAINLSAFLMHCV